MPTKRNSLSGIVTGYGSAGAAQGGRGFNVNDYAGFRNKAGILRTHDFHIEMPWPPGLPHEGFERTWRNLELTCDSINFPTTALVTYQVAHYSYGAMEQKPTIPQFSNLECTFVTDQDSNLWRFFHKWLQLTVNYRFQDNTTNNATMNVYEISYTQEYTVDMWLYIYNPFGNLVRKVGFRQAYPIAVADVSLAWSAGNQLIRIPVTFAFFDWQDTDEDLFGATGTMGFQPPTDTGPIK